jgi:tellurite resistance protein TehA-like permease
LYNFPYGAGWLQRLGITIFILNIFIFALLSIGHIARYIRFKGLFTASINHLMSGMFWGTLPMGLVTIIVGIVLTTRVATILMNRTWSPSFAHRGVGDGRN